ncbi:cystatin-M isoform X1 [Cricetulus griseus]|nr:cystatin-M isoform X1 [Cricetulus griseus]XP_027297264.1 cystatin-M isoform X1 [Cricetulus griseus]XP_035316336.1 cystatin-M isoform X1 [Cricetulus griseus]
MGEVQLPPGTCSGSRPSKGIGRWWAEPGGASAEPVKAAQDGASALTSAAMERPHFPLAMGLALLAFCLLTLSSDARAELRSRRTGERQTMSPNDPLVQKAAQAAVSSYNMGSNSLYYFRDTRILDAQCQLVAGLKCYLTMDLESTECRKTRVSGDHTDLTACPLAAGVQQEKLRCRFEVLQVPWKNTTQLLKHDCMQV